MPATERNPPNLAGKDFLSLREAAHYACVSESQFRRCAKDYGISPRTFMGRVVYRREDIEREMHRLWQN